MAKRVLIAATNQHIGKTTTTLGLVKALSDKGLKVSYCKPVGQQHISRNGVTADKDAFLFSKMMNFDVTPEVHSPVIIGSGVTTKYLEDPSQFNFKEKLLYSQKVIESDYDFVVYEGTGHPGVGSICEVNNADVAKLLNTPVIMIVEGGIGRTIDRLNMSIALFREAKVPVLGVIVNKVLPSKIEKITRLLKIKLDQMGLELFGVIPYDEKLSFPIMRTVKNAIGGKVIMNANSLDNMVECSVSASLMDEEELLSYKNILLVTHYKRADEAIMNIQKIFNGGCPLSGVILTGEGNFDDPFLDHFAQIDHLRDHNVPLVITKLDTLGAVRKINRIEVKINTRTMWKVHRAVKSMKAHVDLDRIIEAIS